MVQVYMPLWDEQELVEAQGRCFPSLNSALVRKRYAKYGGIARHVLEHSDEDAAMLFQSQLSALSLEDMKRVFAAGSYENLPSFANLGYLLHVRPKGEMFTVAFASGYTFEHIQRHFIKEELADAKTFAKFLRHHPDLAGIYGTSLEGIAHTELSGDSEGRYSFHSLSAMVRLKRDAIADTRVVQWPKCREKWFHSLVEVMPYVYYHPYSKIYETIDSFVVMDGSLLDPVAFKPGVMVLVFIQVTVSKNHKVSGAKVKEVHRDVFARLFKRPVPSEEKELLKELPRILVFVTRKYPAGIHSYQKLSATEPVLPQYALVLEKDFEIVWKELEHRLV